MVIHDSYVTRKPLQFTLIVLTIVLVILLPIYIYSFYAREEPNPDMITQSYNEVNFYFSPESELSLSDKRHMFSIFYEGGIVQWRGNMISCIVLDNMYRVGVDHQGNGQEDVVFTTFDDCNEIPEGYKIIYHAELIDRINDKFIGRNGEISK
ncbi:hypothetical protein HQ545_05895 [Candidatus Woesearchaeota archaeon]|nr:hypothetical protein [Candidatus Woesearchaeota archaeon]